MSAVDGAKARTLIRHAFEQFAGEPFTAADLLCQAQNDLALEDAIESAILGRKRANRSIKRRARVAVNVRALGQYLTTIAARRYRYLQLEARYNSHHWIYSIADRRPLGKKQIKKLLAVPRIDVQPTVTSIRKVSKALEREEKQRGKAAWELAKLEARATWEAAQQRDRYGRIIEPKPAAPAPAPAPRIERAPRPALCKFGGEISGRYADGRCRGCGRRHD